MAYVHAAKIVNQTSTIVKVVLKVQGCIRYDEENRLQTMV